MKKIAAYLVWFVLVAGLPLMACSKDEATEVASDSFGVSFDCPSLIEVSKGGEYTFQVEGGEEPQASDVLVLESTDGISYTCTLVSVSENSFTVKISEGCESGTYRVFIKRGDRKKQIGSTYINIVEGMDFTPDAGTTVYGVVSTADGPVPGVVVSDGVEVTVTNEQGIYQLQSDKEWGYVFISVPAGYEVPAEGVLPQFYKMMKGDASTAERVDFSLTAVDGQDDYKVLVLGDMHLANRTGDLKQFMEFTSDLNAYRALHQQEKMYAIALGDMTWDLYWYSNSYALPEYLNTINSQVKGLQIFHTIGNHDYDYKATNDRDAESRFMDYIAPTYYSFNLGKVHYVVLDDIDCSNYDGTTSRDYEKRVSAGQLSWLAKDLSHVDKSVPLVVVMHAQVFYPSQTDGFKVDHDVLNTTQLLNVLDGYKVHFITGHTHMNYNVTPDDAVTGGREVYEHNTGAICGSWWWSGYLTPGVHLSPDGTPGGYAIWSVNGTDMEWMYKATGWTEDYQFRSYDLNNVHFSLADVPQMPAGVPASVKKEYMKYVDAYPENQDNEVLINVWNWNPRWTLKVTDENGNTLTPEEVWAYDPLHVAAMSVKRFNSSTLTSTPSFITEKFPHFFKVKAADADVDLTITVCDEFGHQWTENMQRPKAFSTDAYLPR
ncbi:MULTISPECIES: calcineurin-like phosphoesterase family protein [Bacteroidaceae]|jgi:hypothetical protein|uniref:calcineurin-like phosphoesterase family protein n=1 Tax=Bacteroidaceae TaxID=815 RepID=UPI0025EDAF34|nr:MULTISPECIES: calcineurin-like phosphoesterase family protein [Bacteroidaceae]